MALAKVSMIVFLGKMSLLWLNIEKWRREHSASPGEFSRWPNNYTLDTLRRIPIDRKYFSKKESPIAIMSNAMQRVNLNFCSF